MSAQPLAILASGMVTSVGLTAAASCAAIRAKLTNPTETRFLDSEGEWIMAHSVPLEQAWRGREKICQMAVMAISECLAGLAPEARTKIPLLLCLADRNRAGRPEGLDDELFLEIQAQLGIEFSEHSVIVPQGRVAAVTALQEARRLLTEGHASYVLLAASDSLLNWQTLRAYEGDQRLLTPANSNGFMPGEAAAAVLLGHPAQGQQLLCLGLGLASEPASITTDQPLRASGLARAIREAAADAGCDLNVLDFRITDLSGEQYYFKEAALALSRLLRTRKDEFDIWHPAECIGEVGSASGVAMLVVAEAACRKGYAPGPTVLCHSASDDGQRTAAILRWQAT